jgi:mono/diheme cytochrome c family protein
MARLLTFLLLLTLALACTSVHQSEPVEVKLASGAEVVQHGKALTGSLCGPCHFDPATNKYTGKQMLDIPKALGRVYARNLTQHPDQGIGSYTAGELAYLIRTGIKKDGHYSMFMLKPNLAEEDISAIVAFLKSEDPLVQAADVESPKTKFTPVAQLMLNLMMKPLPYPKEKISRPSQTDPVAYGKYLVDVIGCYECHSASPIRANKLEPEKSKGYMGGGSKFRGLGNRRIYGANLTFDPETGIGKWTERDFVRAVKEGVRNDNSVLRFPMPMFPDLTDAEAAAIFAYLKTVPVIKNQVKRPAGEKAAPRSDTAPDLVRGEELYRKYACFSCHGEQGVGIGDLTLAYQKYTEEEIEGFIKGSFARHANSRMPRFEGVIAEEDFPKLIQYVKWLGESKHKSKRG